MKTISQFTPKKVRALIRKGRWTKPTAGLVLGYAQANLVILPEKNAFDFLPPVPVFNGMNGHIQLLM